MKKFGQVWFGLGRRDLRCNAVMWCVVGYGEGREGVR